MGLGADELAKQVVFERSKCLPVPIMRARRGEYCLLLPLSNVHGREVAVQAGLVLVRCSA